MHQLKLNKNIDFTIGANYNSSPMSVRQRKQKSEYGGSPEIDAPEKDLTTSDQNKDEM